MNEKKQLSELELLRLYAQVSTETFIRAKRYYKTKGKFKDNKHPDVQAALQASKTMEARQWNGIKVLNEQFPNILAGINLKY